MIAYQMQTDSALGLCSDYIAHVPPLSHCAHHDVAILHANVGRVCHNMQGSLCRASATNDIQVSLVARRTSEPQT